MNTKRLVLALLLTLAGCRRGHSASIDAGAAAEPRAQLASLTMELVAITGAPPAPSPTLGPGVGLSSENTLVIASDELAMLRRERSRSAPDAHTPERTTLVDMLIEAGGGAVQNRYLLTDLSRETALRTIAGLAYFAVVEEEEWVAGTSIQSIGIWDRAARKWVGTLQVALPLTKAPDKEMAQFRGGTQVGPSFTVSETAEAREERYRQEIHGVVIKALKEHHQQWAERPESAPTFHPSDERVYAVPVPPDGPTLGPADAKVVVQVFAPHGHGGMVLLLRHVAQVYGDRVRIVWRDRIVVPIDTAAANAAREVLAAKGMAAFWSYVARLCPPDDPYADLFTSLTIDKLVNAAVAVGVDSDRVRKAIDGNVHRKAIEADGAALRAAGLSSSPTVATFINGWTQSNDHYAPHAARIDAALSSSR